MQWPVLSAFWATNIEAVCSTKSLAVEWEFLCSSSCHCFIPLCFYLHRDTQEDPIPQFPLSKTRYDRRPFNIWKSRFGLTSVCWDETRERERVREGAKEGIEWVRGFQIKEKKLAACPCCGVGLGRLRNVAAVVFFWANSDITDKYSDIRKWLKLQTQESVLLSSLQVFFFKIHSTFFLMHSTVVSAVVLHLE